MDSRDMSVIDLTDFLDPSERFCKGPKTVQPTPGTDLIGKVKDLLFSGVFSDLTLTCGEKSFKVHRNILYMQSDYFRKLLNGPFKENGASTIDFPDDDPSAFAALIHYLYHFTLDTNHLPADLVFIYAIADKYDISSLCRLAIHRLDKACKPLQGTEDFVSALRATSDCMAEDTMWDILLPKVKANITHLLKCPSFRKVVTELPSLTLPLLGLFDPRSWQQACAKKRKRLEVDDDYYGGYDPEGMPLSGKQQSCDQLLDEDFGFDFDLSSDGATAGS